MGFISRFSFFIFCNNYYGFFCRFNGTYQTSWYAVWSGAWRPKLFHTFTTGGYARSFIDTGMLFWGNCSRVVLLWVKWQGLSSSQVALEHCAQSYKYHHQSDKVASDKLVWNHFKDDYIWPSLCNICFYRFIQHLVWLPHWVMHPLWRILLQRKIMRYL